jgi:hypothetical protein
MSTPESLVHPVILLWICLGMMCLKVAVVLIRFGLLLWCQLWLMTRDALIGNLGLWAVALGVFE